MYRNISIKYGILAGVGVIAYLLLFYFISPRLMLSSGVIWSTLIIYLVFMYRATVKVGEQAAYFPFQLALRPAFMVYVLVTLFYYTFYYLMFNVFDPGLLEVQQDLIVENAQRLEGLIGDEQLKNQLEQLSLEELQVTLKNVAMGAGRSIIGGFILSLILAGLLRKD